MKKLSVNLDEYQTTVSDSFKLFKQENAFFDVTLVSEDQKPIQTHKIVLSACSSFFKSILENSTQSHPLIYLSGVNYQNLQFLVDYIYEGEIRLLNDKLESFIEIAKELQIAGLLKDEIFNDYFEDFIIREDDDDEVELEDVEVEEIEKKQKIKRSAVKSQKQSIRYKPVIDVSYLDKSEVKQKIKEIMVKEGDYFKCSVCGNMTKEYSNMRRHIDVHIKGLSYECWLCNRTFSKMHSLARHKSHHHKGQCGYVRAKGQHVNVRPVGEGMEQKNATSAGME